MSFKLAVDKIHKETMRRIIWSLKKMPQIYQLPGYIERTRAFEEDANDRATLSLSWRILESISESSFN